MDARGVHKSYFLLAIELGGVYSRFKHTLGPVAGGAGIAPALNRENRYQNDLADGGEAMDVTSISLFSGLLFFFADGGGTLLDMMVTSLAFTQLLLFVLTVVPFWKIFTKAGFSGWLVLLMIVPAVWLGVLYYVAFAEWRIKQTPGV